MTFIKHFFKLVKLPAPFVVCFNESGVTFVVVIMSVVKCCDIVGVDASGVVWLVDGFIVVTSLSEEDIPSTEAFEVVVSSHVASHGRQRDGSDVNFSLVPWKDYIRRKEIA